MARNDNRDIFSLYITKHQIVNEDTDDMTNVSPTTPTEAEEHDETDMSNPEERKEVQIGKKIVDLCKAAHKAGHHFEEEGEIEKLANELIRMHQASSVDGPVRLNYKM